MNLVECYVTEIIGEPYFKYDMWWIKVKYNSYGVISETELCNKNKNPLLNIAIGFMFLS